MTASQIYVLEPLSQDDHHSCPMNDPNYRRGFTPLTCNSFPTDFHAMTNTYNGPLGQLPLRLQEDQPSVMLRGMENNVVSYNSNTIPAHVYHLPQQQTWQLSQFSSNPSNEPTSLTGTGFSFNNSNLWQPNDSYGLNSESHLVDTSNQLSGYPISSSAPIPQTLGYHTTGSPSYQLSPTGSDALPLRNSPPSVIISATPTLPASAPSGSSSSSSGKRYTYQQEYELFLNATRLPAINAGPFIPQTIYKPHTTSDRKRYVEEISLEGPLYFAMQHPSEYGIPLSDALHSRVKRLVDREKPVFEGRGPSVSVRLEWPGYRQWTRQIPTKDFRSPPGPITMAKLAKNIAKCVQRFIDENKDRNLEESTDRRWKVGSRPNELGLDDLILVSVHHVSLGSWQPHLRLRRATS